MNMALARNKFVAKKGLLACGVSVLITLALGALGGLATFSSVATWYAQLNKPAFNPPNFVFGPVWTILYIIMALAAWRVWLQAEGADRRTALVLYAAQLVLNLGWSVIFFGLRQPAFALGEIIILFLAILATIGAFWRVDRLASLMMTPYAVWVAFASFLNFGIWRLN